MADAGAAHRSAVTDVEPLFVDVAGAKPRRAARTLKRAREQQQARQHAAEAAVARADDNPALGALNRHLNMMMQQLTAAHRVIGRVAAERDALRQQLADLQGIPVEEIIVTTVGASSDQSANQTEKAPLPSEEQPKTGLARFNYFSAEDIAVARKRRQSFALILLALLLVLWMAGRMGYIQLPDNVSKDSLSGLPYIGDLMSYFLAGWLLYRLGRVSSKGVRWVFPSESTRRRKR